MTDKPTPLLEHHLKEPQLPSFLREHRKMVAQCAAENVDHPQYSLRLAELELIDRHQRRMECRTRAARFPAVKSLDTFDFLAIPSMNKALVMELARCEYVERRENVIAVGNSGTGYTHVALGASASSAGPRCLSARHVRGLHHRRRPGPRADGGPGRETAAEFTKTDVPPEPADHRRTGLRALVPHRCVTAIRDVQPARRAGFHPGNHQRAFRRVDGSIRLGTAHPPRPHPGDERREIPAQAQPGKRPAPSPGRPSRRLARSTPQSAHILSFCLQLSLSSQLPPCWWPTVPPPQWSTLPPPLIQH